MSVDCESASWGLWGVWKTQGWGVVAREFRGDGVRSLISSLESTLSGSYGTRPAPAKPPWIFLSYRGQEGLTKAAEELELAHVVDMRTYQVLNLATVRPLQRPKVANIKWLEEVRGMWRYVECDDVVLLVIELEFG